MSEVERLKTRIAELENAIEDVCAGTRLDKVGNRDMDGLQATLGMHWSPDSRVIRNWFHTLDKVRK